MKVNAVLQAQSVRYQHLGSFGQLAKLIDPLRERYHFTVAPARSDIFAAPPGPGAVAIFRHGSLTHGDARIAVDTFAVHALALSASVASSTDDADVFLDDVAQFLLRMDIRLNELSRARNYLSSLEVEFDETALGHFGMLEGVGRDVRERLSGYGVSAPVFDLSALALGFNPFAVGQPAPLSHFRIQRLFDGREGGERFLADAPLRTLDHVATLETLERALLTGVPAFPASAADILLH